MQAEIVRYDREAPTLPSGSFDFDSLLTHVQATLGPVVGILAEPIPISPPISILLVEPTEGREFWTLVTAGASATRMSPPADVGEPDAWRRAEFILSVPTSWISRSSNGGFAIVEPNLWSFVAQLKIIARAPALYGAFFAPLDTAPNGDPPEPIVPGSDIAGFLIYWPVSSPHAATFRGQSDEAVNCYALIGLTSGELRYASENGSGGLLERFEQSELDECISPNREALVGRIGVGA